MEPTTSDAKRSRIAKVPLTVTQVTGMVKRALESALPGTIHVLGEITNFKRHSSGHLYLTLKDAASELACVMWRSAAETMRFRPQDGMEVIASGTIEVFERAGRYQLYIRKLEPRGIGALELAFRQLCEKLNKEGLFDERRKRPLPRYPGRIAIVTSPTGAAVADMLRTIQRRFPCVHVLLYPVRVQGPEAAGEIAAAIRRLNENDEKLGGIDVMIVGRGGGSLEDLWAFNEEIVARAIYASRIPIVSAVGHETDVTIADFVADVRAATPTAAAELAVPVLGDVLSELAAYAARMTRSACGRCELGEARLTGLVRRNAIREPLTVVYRREQLIDELAGRVHGILVHRLHMLRRRLDALEPVLQRIAPHAALLRNANRLQKAGERLRWAMASRWTTLDRALTRQVQRLERASPDQRVRHLRQQLDRLDLMIPTSLRHRLRLLGERLRGREEHLAALSYKSVLERGFSITRTKRDGKVIRHPSQLKDHDRIVTQLTDGEIESEVVNLHQLDLFD